MFRVKLSSFHIDQFGFLPASLHDRVPKEPVLPKTHFRFVFVFISMGQLHQKHSQFDAYPPLTPSYPAPEATQGPYVTAPPPMGYPVKDAPPPPHYPYHHTAPPSQSQIKGSGGFFHGCLAALCCCWILDCVF